MSKSFDWCINRVKDPVFSGLSDRQWENAVEEDVTRYIQSEFLENNWMLTGTTDTGEHISLKADLKVNPDQEYDYYIFDSTIHDGTLLCIIDTCMKVVSRILSVSTYNKILGKPQNGDFVHYQIGNLVILSEYDGDWVPKDKPWCMERTTVLLPVRVWYE